jgi:hypothetical protein
MSSPRVALDGRATAGRRVRLVLPQVANPPYKLALNSFLGRFGFLGLFTFSGGANRLSWRAEAG